MLYDEPARTEQELLERELALLASAPGLPEAIRKAEAAAVRAEDRMLRAPGPVLAEEELRGAGRDSAESAA